MNSSNYIKEFKLLEKENLSIKYTTKLKILNTYISKDSFIKALTTHTINSSAHKDFPEVYNFYTTFFTLPDETETFEGFEKALILNHHRDLQRQYGSFEEAWIYVREPDDKKIIGGVNFSIYKSKEILASLYSGTAHITYIFVDEKFRGLGIARYLHELAIIHAQKFVKTPMSLLFFCEQNAPELMTIDAYFSDNINALVDQCDRLVWWHKMGYKRLNINYVQPPLNKGQKVCDNLTLNVKTKRRKIPTSAIVFHLKHFFDLAVFKADTSRRDAHYFNQIEHLKKSNSINTSGSIAYYKELKKRIYRNPEACIKLRKLF